MKYMILFLFSLQSFAGYVVPPLGEVLVRSDKSVEDRLYEGREYSVLVWNIYKQARSGFYQEADFIKDFDITLLQEINETRSWKSFLNNFDVDYNFAISFYDDGIASGVGVFSKVQLSKVWFDRSSAREPVIKTPKMTIMGELNIHGREDKLMVVSIHGINFVRNKFFNGQIHAIVEKLRAHQGPMIWAGDFNTWNKSRLWYMNYRLQELKLVKVKLKDDHYIKRFTGKPLDHVFARGLEVSNASALNRKESSDHNPMVFDFEISPY